MVFISVDGHRAVSFYSIKANLIGIGNFLSIPLFPDILLLITILSNLYLVKMVEIIWRFRLFAQIGQNTRLFSVFRVGIEGPDERTNERTSSRKVRGMHSSLILDFLGSNTFIYMEEFLFNRISYELT